MKLNKDYAIKTSVELAKSNIESSQHWTNPDSVVEFIEAVYNYLSGEKSTEE